MRSLCRRSSLVRRCAAGDAIDRFPRVPLRFTRGYSRAPLRGKEGSHALSCARSAALHPWLQPCAAARRRGIACVIVRGFRCASPVVTAVRCCAAKRDRMHYRAWVPLRFTRGYWIFTTTTRWTRRKRIVISLRAFESHPSTGSRWCEFKFVAPPFPSRCTKIRSLRH